MPYLQGIVQKRTETPASSRVEFACKGQNLIQNLYKTRTPLRLLGRSDEPAGGQCVCRRGPRKLMRAFSRQIGQRGSNSGSTGKFDKGILFHGGASSSVGWLCRNDNPTRCSASFQITQTPDSPMAQLEAVPGKTGRTEF